MQDVLIKTIANALAAIDNKTLPDPDKMTATQSRVLEEYIRRATQVLMLVRIYDQGVAQYGDMNFRPPNTIPVAVLLAAEFAYKSCEKGDNLQMMFGKLRDIYTETDARNKLPEPR